MCEKPIVTAPEQFDELCAFAAEKGLVYMEAIMMRYLPAREILHKAMGRLGGFPPRALIFRSSPPDIRPY